MNGNTWSIRFPKDMVAKAKEKGRDLVAYGYDNKSGRAEFFMYFEEENSTFVFFFMHELNKGTPRNEAFAIADQKLADAIVKRETNRAAKTATETPRPCLSHYALTPTPDASSARPCRRWRS